VGKYNGALCRLCRAEGTKLFLKGKRCLTEKCSLDRRSYPPGQRGSRIQYRRSDYKIQLREKQKVKRFYGIGERQFRLFFKKAGQKKGITGENLLKSLEMRFDNILYRMNFAYSRAHARQMIKHGHVNINGRKVSLPSYQLKLNDVIEFREKAKKSENFKAVLDDLKGLVEVPEWLLVEPEKMSGKVNAIPNRDDVSLDVEEHLIVELYSK
jgi:small subunit ribosomal protein S4